MARRERQSFWRRLTRSKLTVALGGFLLLVALVSFARELLRRIEVKSDIARLQQEVDELEERKTNLSNLIEYFESPLFQEQEAREKLGLAKPGESVVVVPLTGDPALVPGSEVSPKPERSNPAKWWQYFFNPSAPSSPQS